MVRKKATTKKKATKRKTTARRTTTKRAPAKRKTAARKVVRKKTAVRKTTRAVAKKAPALKKMPTTGIKQAMNKSQLAEEIATYSGLTKKDVNLVLENLTNVMHRHLRKGAAGEFKLPGVSKWVVKRKPATKARKGVNPFTGEEIMIKAKPARNVVKVRPLKKLKEVV